tara:strand:+ start:4416 stop:4664 length:249 start_codon:yes stop_codon:yes gene_type:complete
MLSEQEQIQLKEILNSPLFKKAQEQAIAEGEGPVYHLPAPEQGMALAAEKGLRNAFRTLHLITQPRKPNVKPKLAQQFIPNK